MFSIFVVPRGAAALMFNVVVFRITTLHNWKSFEKLSLGLAIRYWSVFLF